MSRYLPVCLLLATTLLVTACACPSAVSGDSDPHQTSEMRGQDGLVPSAQLPQLFNNVTAYGVISTSQSPFIRYYAADGRVIDLQPVRGRREGRWQVHGEQLCIRWDAPLNCTRVRRQDNQLLLQQTLTSDATHEAARIERLLPGNPEHLE